MTTDTQKEIYREEAGELLADIENALLELEERPDDAEQIARAFRALHTIKGSGAMAGFDDIAAFSHELESLFDRVRAKEHCHHQRIDKLHLSRMRSDSRHAE